MPPALMITHCQRCSVHLVHIASISYVHASVAWPLALERMKDCTAHLRPSHPDLQMGGSSYLGRVACHPHQIPNNHAPQCKGTQGACWLQAEPPQAIQGAHGSPAHAGQAQTRAGACATHGKVPRSFLPHLPERLPSQPDLSLNGACIGVSRQGCR